MKNYKAILLALLILVPSLWSCGSGGEAIAPIPPAHENNEMEADLSDSDDPQVLQPEEGDSNNPGPQLPANPVPDLADAADPASQAEEGIARFAPPRIERFRIFNSVQQTQRKTQQVSAEIIQQGQLENGIAQIGIYYYPMGRNAATSPTLDFAFSPAGENFSGSLQIEGPVAFRFSNQSAWDYDFQHWTPAWNENSPRRNLVQLSGENLRQQAQGSMRICPAMVHPLATTERHYLQRAHPFTFDNGIDHAEFGLSLLPETQCPIFRLEEVWGNLQHLYPEIRFLYVLRVLSQNGNVIEEREAELVVQFACGKWEYNADEEAGNFWNIDSQWANNYRCIPVE